MVNLPVREMVLYKHGIGFFVRQGTVEGEQVTLTFRQDEINDVLKSLAVFDQAGGQVLGIHYQTPMDKQARLASSSIKLSQKNTLRDLLRDLRGRDCELTFEVTAGTQETIIGRIIGIDEVQTEEEFSANVSILTEKGISVFPYDALRTFKITDEQSTHDLSYFLDTSMSEDNRRVVNVRLTAGEHDLAVYYVAPSPTWRVSYRLIADRKDDETTGKAYLQGWGLFDNRLEEDLENVNVTLVAGQPISFIYDLYTSKIPDRPFIEDESRIAPGPIEYAGATMDYMMQDQAEMDSFAEAAPAPMVRRAKMRSMSVDEMQTSAQIQSETKDSGETFQYIVTTPVTVKRGESALVPIIGYEMPYDRELLYNGAKFADHPVAALRFDNSSGLTLERGPVTVVENGDYKGEAVIPFTKDNNQVYVPFAVELGIKITERPINRRVVAGLNIQNNAMFEQVYKVSKVTYIVENNTPSDQVVTIEAPINHRYELHETRPADVETANDRRWHVAVEAHSKTEFIRTERHLQSNRVSIRNLQYKTLQNYLEQNWIDDATFTRLKDILDQIQSVSDNQQRIANFTNERQSIYDKQEQIRANLGALQSTGQEATLRNRLLKQLENTQDRLELIEREINQANEAIANSEKTIEHMISNLK